MTDMCFFQPANLGPVWMKVNEPQPQDFVLIRELTFKHVLCGHGSPVRDNAKEAFTARFTSVFGV